MADKHKQSPLLERTGSLTGDATLSDFLEKYNLKDYLEPALAAAVGLPIVGRYAKPVAKAVGKEAARRAGKYATESGLVPHVIKPEGGQWINSFLEQGMPKIHGDNPDVNRWLDTAARKYIVRDLATPSDPIRALMDQGITHINPEDLGASAVKEFPIVKVQRSITKPENGILRAGDFVPYEAGASPLGKYWDVVADDAVNRMRATDAARKYGAEWAKELPYNEAVYWASDRSLKKAGIDQLARDLEEDIASGALRPEQLNKISIADAVKRSHEKRLVRELADYRELPIVSEYPEGYSWRDLTSEDPAQLKKILSREGDIMQNCIGGYCEDMMDEGIKLYSLRDKAGNPHVNIEVRPSEQHGEAPYIYQIKGKQNEAPTEDYIPYVQDFIRSQGPFSRVNELSNAGLLDLRRAREEGIFDERVPEVSRELRRIFPMQRGPSGSSMLSGEHGVYIPEDLMIKNILKDMPGDYGSKNEVLDYLRTIEQKPIEQSYSKWWEDNHGVNLDIYKDNVNEMGFAEGGLVKEFDPDEHLEFIDNIRPSAMLNEFADRSSEGKAYTYGVDIDLLNKMGIGADVRNIDVKHPGGRFKENALGEVRGYYNTDDGANYSASFRPSVDPNLRAWVLRRISPKGDSELSIEHTPRRQYTYNPDEFGSQGPVNVNESPTTWLKFRQDFAGGGQVKDPFADMSMADKIAILARGAKKRYFDYYAAANKHGEYPDILAAELKHKYPIELGTSRENRTPLDVAINYGGGYDFAANKDIPAQDVRDMAKAYQLWDYMTSYRDKAEQDAINDYYENMAGVEAGIAGRGKGRMSEEDILNASSKYGRSKATAKPAFDTNYAEGGAVDYDSMFEFK